MISYDETSQSDSDVHVFVNDGTGAFLDTDIVTEGRRVNALRLADIDDDSDLDLVLGQVSQATPMWVVTNESGLAVVSGALLDEVDGSVSIGSIDVADMNGDDKADIVATDFRGNRIITLTQDPSSGVSVEDETSLGRSDAFALTQNYPNPFTSSTVIRYYLPVDEEVELSVFDVLGRKVETLVSGFKSSGWHEQSFEAKNLPVGVYFYTMSQGAEKITQKMVLLD